MTIQEGWAQPIDARKFHYFRKGMSLCGRWGFYFGVLTPDALLSDFAPKDCAACMKKVKKQIRQAAPKD